MIPERIGQAGLASYQPVHLFGSNAGVTISAIGRCREFFIAWTRPSHRVRKGLDWLEGLARSYQRCNTAKGDTVAWAQPLRTSRVQNRIVSLFGGRTLVSGALRSRMANRCRVDSNPHGNCRSLVRFLGK